MGTSCLSKVVSRQNAISLHQPLEELHEPLLLLLCSSSRYRTSKRTLYCFWLVVDNPDEGLHGARRNSPTLLPLLDSSHRDTKMIGKLALAHIEFLANTGCINRIRDMHNTAILLTTSESYSSVYTVNQALPKNSSCLFPFSVFIGKHRKPCSKGITLFLRQISLFILGNDAQQKDWNIIPAYDWTTTVNVLSGNSTQEMV